MPLQFFKSRKTVISPHDVSEASIALMGKIVHIKRIMQQEHTAFECISGLHGRVTGLDGPKLPVSEIFHNTHPVRHPAYAEPVTGGQVLCPDRIPAPHHIGFPSGIASNPRTEILPMSHAGIAAQHIQGSLIYGLISLHCAPQATERVFRYMLARLSLYVKSQLREVCPASCRTSETPLDCKSQGGKLGQICLYMHNSTR